MFNLARCIINIMEIGFNTQYNSGSNYSTKIKDEKELLEEKKEVQETKSEDELTESEKQMVIELQARDAEVRAHEAAHQSGGASTGGATYTYQQGPDGKMYAIGGEVSISFQTGSTPQETIANAQAVIASALAPSDPSAQDMAVASSAMVMMVKAQQQLAKEMQEEMLGKKTYQDEANPAKEENKNSLESFEISV